MPYIALPLLRWCFLLVKLKLTFFFFSWLTADFWHNILRCARSWLNLKAVQASHNSHLTVWKTFFCAFLYKVKQVDRLLCLIKRSLRLYRRTGAVCIVIYVIHYLHWWDFYYVCYTWHWKHLIGSFTTLWVFILKKTAPLLKGRNNSALSVTKRQDLLFCSQG